METEPEMVYLVTATQGIHALTLKQTHLFHKRQWKPDVAGMKWEKTENQYC